MSLRIVAGGLDDPRVIALLEHHVAMARSLTPASSAHALDLDRLKVPAIRFWALWDAEEPIAIGALKRLSTDHGEVKSMHVVAARRGQGAAGIMLDTIVASARADGLRRLSLETGSSEHFAPARALYRRHGFAECAPFEGYVLDPHSVFMTLAL